jgi:hypothetical protein
MKLLFDPNKVHFSDFKMLKGQVETPSGMEIPSDLQFLSEFSLSIGLGTGNQSMRVDLGVEIKVDAASAEVTPIRGSFLFAFVYQIENIDELVQFSESEAPQLDYHLSVALAGITYSTVRGILMTRLQGTLLERFIMPVINPADLINNGKIE